MTTYTITFTNGRRSIECDSYAEALATVGAEFDAVEIGHDGDLSDGGDRTLFWASAEDAQDDDGARALGGIVRTEARR